MLYEILYPKKDYIGANDMDRAVELYVKSNKNVDRIIITDHIQEGEYNIIKIKNKTVIKRISKGLKGFNVSMQTPVFFSGNYGNSNNIMTPSVITPSVITPIGPASTLPPTRIAPSAPSVPSVPSVPSLPTIHTKPTPPIDTGITPVSIISTTKPPIPPKPSRSPIPIIHTLSPPSIDKGIAPVSIISTPKPPVAPKPSINPMPTINKVVPPSLDPIPVPDGTKVKPVKNIKENDKFTKLNICVMFKNEIWRVINIFKHNKNKYISIQSQYDSNKKLVIKYNKSDIVTGEFAKRIIRKCINILSQSSKEYKQQDPFNIDIIDPKIETPENETPGFEMPENEMISETDDDNDDDFDDDFDNFWYEESDEEQISGEDLESGKYIKDFEDIIIQHKTMLETWKDLSKLSDSDIQLYIDILYNIEAIYACININKMKKDNVLGKKLSDNIRYIINSKFFRNVYRFALPPQTRVDYFPANQTPAELEIATKNFIRGLMKIIRWSAIYRIRKDINFVDYDKCKSIANVTGMTNEIITRLSNKEHSVHL
jgi:hypothetical protein